MARTGTIKICGLSTAPTLEAALEARADMVGFVFFPKSPRHVSYETARELGAQARRRAGVVALSVDADDAMLEAIIMALRPDLLQLHGQESSARVATIRRRFGLPVMKAIGISGPADLALIPAYAAVCDHLLFDAKPPQDAALPGGNGRAFDWAVLQTPGIDLGLPTMVSGGLDAGNVAQAIAISGARGVDVSSGVETAPGVKDAEMIRAFVASARAAFGTIQETL